MKYIPNLNAQLNVLEYRFRNEYENSCLMIISTLDRSKMAFVKGHRRRDVPELGPQQWEVKISSEGCDVSELFNYASSQILTYLNEHERNIASHKCEREEYNVFFEDKDQAATLIGKMEKFVSGSLTREVLSFLGAYIGVVERVTAQPKIPKRTNPNWGAWS